MSQVSVLFKNRILSIHPLNQYDEFIIGHASACKIHIDSLAVGLQQAKITFHQNYYLIERLDPNYKLLINDTPIESSIQLSTGDHINLGKHTLVFSFDERNENQIIRKSESKLQVADKGIGWIQFLNGREMGKTMRIKKCMANIADEKEDNIAMISNRSDGFYLSYLKGKHPPKVNKVDIGEKSYLLTNNSKISLGSQELLFYIG